MSAYTPKVPNLEDGIPDGLLIFTKNQTLFSKPPSLGDRGTLRFTPAANALGTANVKLRLPNQAQTKTLVIKVDSGSNSLLNHEAPKEETFSPLARLAEMLSRLEDLDKSAIFIGGEWSISDKMPVLRPFLAGVAKPNENLSVEPFDNQFRNFKADSKGHWLHEIDGFPIQRISEITLQTELTGKRSYPVGLAELGEAMSKSGQMQAGDIVGRFVHPKPD